MMINKDLIDKKLKLASEFNKIICELLVMAQKKIPTEYVLKSIFNKVILLKSVDELIMIDTCYQNIIKHKKYIIGKDFNYFMNLNPNNYKNHTDSEVIVPMINSFNMHKHKLTNDEINYIWEKSSLLLNLCEQYYKIL